MKKIIIIVILMGAFFSCKKSEDKVSANADLIGSWKLTDVLIDPGDGSGTFQPVTSNKTILFKSNGNISSNGDICDMSIDTYTSSSGTYSTIDSTISGTNCPAMLIKYKITGNYLTVIYPCTEACKTKYIKVE